MSEELKPCPFCGSAAPAEKQYPSMSLYPDAKEYAAACGEVAGWNACRKAMLDAAAAQPVALREKCPLCQSSQTVELRHRHCLSCESDFAGTTEATANKQAVLAARDQ